MQMSLQVKRHTDQGQRVSQALELRTVLQAEMGTLLGTWKPWSPALLKGLLFSSWQDGFPGPSASSSLNLELPGVLHCYVLKCHVLGTESGCPSLSPAGEGEGGVKVSRFPSHQQCQVVRSHLEATEDGGLIRTKDAPFMQEIPKDSATLSQRVLLLKSYKEGQR